MAFHLKSIIGSAVLTAGVALFAHAGQAMAAEASPCTGPSPVAGVEIRGPVLHVIDGATICVALGFEPDTWIRLRLADAPAASPVRRVSNIDDAASSPRGVLMQAALARMATCRTVTAADGSVAAECEIDGRSLGRSLADPQVIAAGYGWR